MAAAHLNKDVVLESLYKKNMQMRRSMADIWMFICGFVSHHVPHNYAHKSQNILFGQKLSDMRLRNHNIADKTKKTKNVPDVTTIYYHIHSSTAE